MSQGKCGLVILSRGLFSDVLSNSRFMWHRMVMRLCMTYWKRRDMKWSCTIFSYYCCIFLMWLRNASKYLWLLFMSVRVHVVRLRLWTAATNGPIVLPPNDILSLENDGGMILTGENERTRCKFCPNVTLSTTNLLGLTRTRTRASAVK
jgi:hypothetical protein